MVEISSAWVWYQLYGCPDRSVDTHNTLAVRLFYGVDPTSCEGLLPKYLTKGSTIVDVEAFGKKEDIALHNVKDNWRFLQDNLLRATDQDLWLVQSPHLT